MAVAQELQMNAINAKIQITVTEDGVVLDVSTVTTKEIVFKKPNGTVVTKTAVFTTTGIDGQIKYMTESGFLDAAGTWQLQANLVFPTGAGYNGRGAIGTFIVKANLV
jgi:hypothetical protein